MPICLKHSQQYSSGEFCVYCGKPTVDVVDKSTKSAEKSEFKPGHVPTLENSGFPWYMDDGGWVY